MADQALARSVKPFTPEDWNGVYDAICQLYFVKDHTLEDTMRIIREVHHFCATRGIPPPPVVSANQSISNDGAQQEAMGI